jgi:SAM-dependent methyltransferase
MFMNEYDAIARYYHADHAEFADDVPFYRELARRTGGPLLEAMCGSGRLLVPLAQAGFQISGIDSSPAMIAIAREGVAQAQLERWVRLAIGDICAPIAGTYRLAIVALNSFMHLTSTQAQLAALAQLHAALEPGGLLALDLFNPNPRLLAEYDNELVFDKQFTMPDGTRVQKFVAQQIDAADQINYVSFFYDALAADGMLRRYATQFGMRWIYRNELEHLLARCGFALQHVYGSYELDPFRSDSDIMLAVAERI